MQLWVDDQRLKCQAPVGRLDASLKAEISQRKAEIIDFLTVSAQRGQPQTAAVRAAARDTERLPITSAQHRLWFLDQLAPGSAAYNIASAIRVIGTLNVPAMEKAIGEIIRRHEVLRTIFIARDGQPAAVVMPFDSWRLRVEELRSSTDPEAAMRRIAAEEARGPFHLSKGPLFRARLLRLTEREHVLLLTVHHIVFDGWSIAILAGELGRLYTAFTRGQPSPLPDLTLQYVDFANWSQQRLNNGELEPQLNYWKEQLAGDLPTLDLPLDRPRPSVQTFRGTTQSLSLSLELTTRLQACAQEWGASLFMVLLAGFKVLLFRYSRQETIVVGSPVASRSRTEFEGLIGYFLNNLVLRTELDGNPPFRDLVDRVRDTVLSASENQEVPFEQLVDLLPKERNLTHSPLFQVLFILQNYPFKKVDLPGVSLQLVDRTVETSRFDLTFELYQTDSGLTLNAEYNTDLFDHETIGQMQAHYQSLLTAAVADPGLGIADLPLMSQAERETQITDWNETRASYSRDTTVADLFESQVKRAPESIAVVFGDQQWTYSELNDRANRLAHKLQALGVGPRSLVGICVERSAEMMVGLLGILKAGAPYLPLDPAYPQDRLRFMISDAEVEFVVSESQLRDELPFAETLVLIDEEPSRAARAVSNPPRQVTEDDLAYVIYTSGSTGQPKGVEIPHAALTNFLESMAAEPGLSATDCLLAVTTICFDISNLEIFLPLITGARVVVAAREDTLRGDRLRELITSEGVTVMQATPASWRLLLQAGWREGDGLKVLCGGEALSRELANEILATGAQLWNMYGPTETTIWSTVSRVERTDAPISIGRPIANTEVYILDDQRRPQPVGVAGELYIGGAGLARGYLNRRELTAERFVAHPFSDSGRVYRTGDLARYRRDGTIECLGRVDRQVKLRGFRIELGEIESVFTTHPHVRQAVATVRTDSPSNQQLVAYFIGQDGADPEVLELRRHLEASLPGYMIPSVIMRLDSLPMTNNGKVDHQRLPQPDGERPLPDSSYVSPRNELEQTMAGIWQDVLELDKVGIHDNFFDIGGNSLLIVTVQSRIEDRLDRAVPLLTFFQHPTIAALVESLSQEESQQQSLPPIENRANLQRQALLQR